MAVADWLRVIDQAAEVGVGRVQFIGGEPTLHPGLSDLITHALGVGLGVEVFSNLYRVSERLWSLFQRRGVGLATSYYSDDPALHDAITRRPGSHAGTRASIIEALRRGIPLRVGIIDLGENQRVERARADLDALGVTAIGYDRMRQVGRGARDTQADISQLCGRCALGVAAVSPDGVVWPCVFARWMPLGNVRDEPLSGILTGRAMKAATVALRDAFPHQSSGRCPPNCDPENECGPNQKDCRPYCVPVTK